MSVKLIHAKSILELAHAAEEPKKAESRIDPLGVKGLDKMRGRPPIFAECDGALPYSDDTKEGITRPAAQPPCSSRPTPRASQADEREC